MFMVLHLSCQYQTVSGMMGKGFVISILSLLITSCNRSWLFSPNDWKGRLSNRFILWRGKLMHIRPYRLIKSPAQTHLLPEIFTRNLQQLFRIELASRMAQWKSTAVKLAYNTILKWGTFGSTFSSLPQLQSICSAFHITYSEIVMLGYCSSPIEPNRPAGMAKQAASQPQALRRPHETAYQDI